VVKILDVLHGDYSYKSIEIDKMNIVAFIPVRGKVAYLNNRPLLAYTIDRARESKYVKRIIVATDNEETARIAEGLGAEVPFIRDPSMSGPSIDLDKVLSYSLHRLEEVQIFPDLIVSLEATFPFRPKGLIDDMIVNLARNGLDSIVAAKAENKAIWKEKDGQILQIDEGLTPRQFKDPTFVELRGVGCITHPEFLRQGRMMGDNIGIYEVMGPYSSIEVRSGDDFKLASLVIKDWFV
jgi:CMP-N-acetylneuraminic acid synthetase